MIFYVKGLQNTNIGRQFHCFGTSPNVLFCPPVISLSLQYRLEKIAGEESVLLLDDVAANTGCFT
jgi:hypothetical protein